MPATSPRHRLLEIERVGDVVLVTFRRPEILSVRDIDLIGRQFSLLAAIGGRVLLNFHEVERLSTPLVGKVLELHHRLKAVDGRLSLCGISPNVFEIFALLRLPRLIPIHADVREALEETLTTPR